MSIPINPVSPRIQYIASALQTVFNVPFPFFTNADLAVYLTPSGDLANDAADILIFSTDYTVTGAGSASGGDVTLNVGAAAGDIITIVRDMLEQRLSLYLPGGLFTAEAVNDDFSMDVMMSQQNQMLGTVLTPHYQFSAPVTTADTELPQLGANQTWVMNSSATQIEATDFNGGGGGGTTGTWVSTAISLTISAGVNYFTSAPGGTVAFTLPASIPAGTTIGIAGFGSTGWSILQGAGQKIHFGNLATTTGAGGSLASTNSKDNVTLLCVVANTTFVVLSGVGNITVV
jgi:hypothetical protein